MRLLFYTLIIMIAVLTDSCHEKDIVPDIVFEASPDSLVFSAAGGKSDLSVYMNGSSWTAASDQTWCTVSPGTSIYASLQVSVTTTSNLTYDTRKAILTFIVDEKETFQIKVSQTGKTRITYPDYSNPLPADAAGMSSNAISLARKMVAGWNLGNSLEATGGETAWGNPATAQVLIDSVKAAGINVIRIPCDWDSYIENTTTCKLKASWLARVKQVVDYCYSANMFVIINIHWDGGWLENNPFYDKQDAVNAKQKAFWQQIAVNFRDYDERLLFAGTNEVNSGTTPTSENFEVQMSYNQTFVDAVRSTGGKNAYRNLIIQAYSTNIDLAVSNLVIAKDIASNRLMVEVHYYDPWEFCGLEADATWGTVKYLWGSNFAQYGTISSWGQESYVLSQFQKMKTSFVDKGYPVILGEFGATRRSSLTGSTLEHHLASRAYYFQYIAEKAKNYGMVPIIWDNGFTGNNGMAVFNRSNGSVFDRQALKAYISGTSAGNYPF